MAYRHLPLDFHDQAKPAAQAALAALKQKKFWEYSDKLFANQESLNSDLYVTLAEELKLDINQFKSDMFSEDTAAQIQADGILASSAEIDGTPTFLVNGLKLVGALPFDSFDMVVKTQLSRVNTRVKAGKKPYQARGEVSQLNLMRAPRKDGGSRKLPALRRVPINNAPKKGAVDPLVTIVVFSGFACSHCKTMAKTYDEIVAAYPNDVQLVFQQYPLDSQKPGLLAAEAALEAHAQGKFWSYHDILFNNPDALSESDLIQHGKSVGLNVSKLRAALKKRTHRTSVEKIKYQGVNLSVAGTPCSFINGKQIEGAHPVEKIKEMIDEALTQAKQFVDSGKVPRKNFYEGLQTIIPDES